MSNDAQALPATSPAVVIGAGPAGLAMAAELGRVGIHAVVIDKAGGARSDNYGIFAMVGHARTLGVRGAPVR